SLIWFTITIILLLGVFSVLLSAKIMAQRRAEAALRQRNRELSLLNRVIAASAAEVETEALLATVCRKLAETFRLPQVAAAMLNEEKTQAVVVAEYLAEGRPSGLHAIIPVPGNPSFEYLMTHKKPLAIADAQHDPLLAPVHDLMHQRGTVSLLLLPLLVEGEVVGSIGLDATEPRPFSADEIELAQRVAEAVSGALARTRLTETHRLLMQAINQSVDTIAITDTEGHITYINPAFERTTGYTRQEALGENLIDLLKSGAHDREFYRHIVDTLRRGQTWQGRVVNRKKDGTRYTDDVIVSPVFNERGEITHYISIQRDISRLIELEEQFHQAQKMEAIGQLTAGIAHDFNNLLTTINGFAELLRFQLAPTDPSVEMVDKIIQAGEQAARLISQLLAFSRKQVIRPRPVNLNQVILGMQGLLHSTLGRPDISLKIHLADDLWPIKADPTQLEQVILNLASNARDALPNGGSVTITTQNMVVDKHLNGHTIKMLPGQYVCLRVEDDGIGMPEDVRAHIFEPFFTTKEVGKGTGLGLASVYGIVRQAGGYIEVETAEGQGSTFTVYWPVIERAVQPAARPTREPGRETILLVEDDASVRGLIKRYLEEQGYHLLIASNGTEALQLAQQYSSPIHLLLTDVVMPEVNGLALADRLIAMYPGMKVIFMSGYPREEVLAPGRWRGTYEFLSKPVSPSTLSKRVRAILDGQRPAQPSPDGLNGNSAIRQQ
ncbi:MAG: hybrid sensor histidine kinase/response regulator, partial [Chloroflexi bacterium]